MPTREVPHFVLQAHEVRVGDEFDVDWTLSANWAEEQRLRDKRNQLIKEQLLDGKTVAYRLAWASRRFHLGGAMIRLWCRSAAKPPLEATMRMASANCPENVLGLLVLLRAEGFTQFG